MWSINKLDRRDWIRNKRLLILAEVAIPSKTSIQCLKWQAIFFHYISRDKQTKIIHLLYTYILVVILSDVIIANQSVCIFFMLARQAKKMQLRGCSHITSAKIRGSWTPPPPSVSNGQHLAYPPSPPRQLSSAFA